MAKLLLYIALLIGAALHAGEIAWAKDFKSGVEQATKANKPIMFIYSNHNCRYCVLLEETTLKDKRVIEGLGRDFVSVVSYTDERDYTPRDLMTPGTPSIWFLFPNGEPMFQPVMGAIDAENFLKALAIVKEEFDNLSEGKAK